MSELSTTVSADVPATPESVQVLRNVAAGVAARMDMPIDQIEEIRLAVTEAATLLLNEASAEQLRMSIARDDDSIEITLSSDGTPDPWPSERALASWPWLVVKGLTDEVRADVVEDQRPSIGFTKRRERVPR